VATVLDRPASFDLPSHVVFGADPDVLAAIHRPSINFTVWERTLAPALVADLAALDLCCARDVRFTAALSELPIMLASALAESGWHGAALTADVLALAQHFAGVMACPAIELRLDVVTDDACRKFHADYVTARLVTTFLGPGTDWLPDGADISTPPQRLDAGAVALFKGRSWPTDNPIIHRSPPIAGTGQRRVVLVLNPAG
jgi:Protein of unknown function (DUF1826)